MVSAEVAVKQSREHDLGAIRRPTREEVLGIIGRKLGQAGPVRIDDLEFDCPGHVVTKDNFSAVGRVIREPCWELGWWQVGDLEEVAAVGIDRVQLPTIGEMRDKNDATVLARICSRCRIDNEQNEYDHPTRSAQRMARRFQACHKSSSSWIRSPVTCCYWGATPHRGRKPPSSIFLRRPRGSNLWGARFGAGSTAISFKPLPSTFI